jgi:predicted aspartyl protease
MKKNLLRILIFSFLINGCSSLKRLKTVTQGKVTQKNYSTTIPFKYVNDQIILSVNISNVKYDFVFDTGNPLTSIDEELLKNIKFQKNNVSYDIGDSQGNSSNNEYISIEKLKVSDIEFQNIGGQVFDHSIYDKFTGCENVKIRGIIGSNLMRKAIWQIDYKNRTIVITDNIETLKIPSKSIIIKTKSGSYGDAFVQLKLNDIEEKFVFDTGYSGFLYTDLKVLNKLGKIQTTKIIQTSFTSTGEYKTENIKGYINNIDLDNNIIKNQIVSFSKGHSNLIGNKFFEHYLVTLDWKDERFYLTTKKEFESNVLSAYEFDFFINYSSGKVEFFNQWLGNTSNTSINFNSGILKVNDINVKNMSVNELCELWKNETDKIYKDNVELEVKENGIKRTVILEKKQLLPK